ncbi:hypothetical protein BJ875DRAFT_215772 [Amylocarpus encephaloides]|uniref:Uncharacterized protein n=1 Tax=Amylocarpus encephaloides TaxID=45428 RepID=A0A9P7YMR8_9HELO|nr:hypothetical protein BJ875DRAFT_215772 [Amylocarpus encephaloides]
MYIVLFGRTYFCEHVSCNAGVRCLLLAPVESLIEVLQLHRHGISSILGQARLVLALWHHVLVTQRIVRAVLGIVECWVIFKGWVILKGFGLMSRGNLNFTFALQCLDFFLVGGPRDVLALVVAWWCLCCLIGIRSLITSILGRGIVQHRNRSLSFVSNTWWSLTRGSLTCHTEYHGIGGRSGLVVCLTGECGDVQTCHLETPRHSRGVLIYRTQWKTSLHVIIFQGRHKITTWRGSTPWQNSMEVQQPGVDKASGETKPLV